MSNLALFTTPSKESQQKIPSNNQALYPSLTQSLTALFGGSLFALGLAPTDYWPLTLLSIVICWYGLQKCVTAKQAFYFGWLYGIGLNGLGISWVFVSIYTYGKMPLLAATAMTFGFVCLLALLFGAVGCGYYFFSRQKYPSILTRSSPSIRAVVMEAVTFSCVWITVEWVRSWLLTGFPWLYFGYIFLDTPFSGLVPIMGTYGIGLLGISVTLSITITLIIKRHRLIALLLAATVFSACHFAINHINWTTPILNKRIAITLVQGNIAQSQKWMNEYLFEHLGIYQSLSLDTLPTTHSASEKGLLEPRLLIWPEAAIPTYPQYVQKFYDDFSQVAENLNLAWITGIPWVSYPSHNTAPHESNNEIFSNAMIVKGKGLGFYSKQKLVPFGEIVPLESWLRSLGPFFNIPFSSFTPGTDHQAPLTAHGYTIAPFICYEIVFPELVRKQAKNTDFILTISNDGWFGHSIGPDQHFQMARMRALELGKAVVRATNNGITAVINEKGSVIDRLPTFQAAALHSSVYPTTGLTPYARIGNMPFIIFCISTLSLSFFYKRRTYKQ